MLKDSKTDGTGTTYNYIKISKFKFDDIRSVRDKLLKVTQTIRTLAISDVLVTDLLGLLGDAEKLLKSGTIYNEKRKAKHEAGNQARSETSSDKP